MQVVIGIGPNDIEQFNKVLSKDAGYFVKAKNENNEMHFYVAYKHNDRTTEELDICARAFTLVMSLIYPVQCKVHYRVDE